MKRTVRSGPISGELRAAQSKLRESEENFRTFFDAVADFLLIVDMSGHILQINKAVVTQLGYPPEALLGQSVLQVHPPEYREAAQETFASMLEGSTEYCTIPLQTRDGRQIPVETRVYRGRWNGVEAFFGVARDLTARKSAEAGLREQTRALERSNAELEQFSYSISHDMRQPLRMISSYLQLIEKELGETFTANQRGYFNFAVNGAQRLDAMLLGLLEYSRVGRRGETSIWMESRTALDDALQFLQPAITEAGAEIRIAGDWPQLFARRDEMLRLLQNLIGNAIKFRIAGRSPVIRIDGERVGVGKRAFWRCCITDNNIGIAAGQIRRIFKVFQRLQRHDLYEGSGLGLALCRRIVEHHGGRIWAESAGENQGSRFCFEILLQDESPQADAPDTQKTSA